MTRTRYAVTAAALLVAATLSGPLSTPTSAAIHAPTSSAAAAPDTATITISSNARFRGYDNPDITLAGGGTLSVYNGDSIQHTVTADDTGSDNRPLFSKIVDAGETVTIAGVSKLAAGTYDFHCIFHSAMKGTLTIVGDGGGGVHPVAPKFEQPLTVPKVLTDAHIRIPIKQADVRVLPDGPLTRMWTYDGTYPGPTIERPAGKDTKVTFVDKLPSAVGPMTVHLHGDHHSSADDGQPTTHLIRHGEERTYNYPLTDDGRAERASTFWYHDHAMGVTGRNVWHGLAGLFLVHDKHEQRLPLPTGRYDIPLMVADRTFDADNQLVDPFPADPMTELTGPTAPPDDATVGQQVLVNGRFAPYKKVSTHRYRLRLVNGSNFTSYNFALSNGKPFHQIGTGNGLLPKPVLRSNILLGPAQRADVIVDFHGDLNKKVILESQPRSDGADGGVATPSVAIMQFRVVREAADSTEIPSNLQARPKLDLPNKIAHTWRFDVAGDKTTGSHWTINGKPFDPSRVDARVPLGSTQKWKLVNDSPVTHYIHLHEERWRTVSRDGGPPKPWERGLEDTWKLDPGESVVVAAKFTDHRGSFMIHCHMLDHEDHGLMTQFKVVRRSTQTATASFRPPAPTPETTTATLSLGGPSLLPVFGSWPAAGRHALPSSREWMCGPKKKKASAEGRTDA